MRLCMFVCKYLRVLFKRKCDNWEAYVPDLVACDGRQLSPRSLPSKGSTDRAPCATLHCGHSIFTVYFTVCVTVYTGYVAVTNLRCLLGD